MWDYTLSRSLIVVHVGLNIPEDNYPDLMSGESRGDKFVL